MILFVRYVKKLEKKTEGNGEIAERLSRFALANLFDIPREYVGKEAVCLLSRYFCELPAGWWIQGPKYTQQAWKIFTQLIGFVIINRGRRIGSFDMQNAIVPMSNRGNPEKGLQESIFFAHKAAQHLADYGGKEWKHFLKSSYTNWSKSNLAYVKRYKTLKFLYPWVDSSSRTLPK